MNSNENIENLLLMSEGKGKRIIKKKRIITKIIKKKSSNAQTPMKEDSNIANNNMFANESHPVARDTTSSFDVNDTSRKQSDTVEADVTNDEINVTYDGDERLQYDKPFRNNLNRENKEEKVVEMKDSSQYLNSLKEIDIENEREVREKKENNEEGIESEEKNFKNKNELEKNKESNERFDGNIIKGDIAENKIDDYVKIEEDISYEDRKDKNLSYENKINENAKEEENKSSEFEKIELPTHEIITGNKEIEHTRNEIFFNNKIDENEASKENLLNIDENNIVVDEKINEFLINIKDKPIKKEQIDSYKADKESAPTDQIIIENIIEEVPNKQTNKESMIVNELPYMNKSSSKDEEVLSNCNKIEDKIQTLDMPLLTNPKNPINNINQPENILKQDVQIAGITPTQDHQHKDLQSHLFTSTTSVPEKIIHEKANDVNVGASDEEVNSKKFGVNVKDIATNIQRVEDITATEENSSNPISTEKELKETIHYVDLIENIPIIPHINTSDMKEPIIEHNTEIVNKYKKINLPLMTDNILSSIDSNVLKTDNLIQMETLTNGESIRNNEIIADITSNAFEAFTSTTNEKTANKTVEAAIKKEVEETNNLQNVFEDGRPVAKKEITSDKIITVNIPEKTPQIITPISKSTEKKSENNQKYSEIVSIEKLEQEDDNKTKKVFKKIGFFEKYAPWLLFSLGGAVFSYFIYRRFTKHK